MEEQDHIVYGDMLVFLMERQFALERSVRALKQAFKLTATLLLEDTTPDELEKALESNEQFLRDTDGWNEILDQYKSFLDFLRAGKKLAKPDA